MSQVKIQEFIISEVKVGHNAHLRKGQTIAARDEKSRIKWTKFMVERGYTESEAANIFKDAYDMAILELRAI